MKVNLKCNSHESYLAILRMNMLYWDVKNWYINLNPTHEIIYDYESQEALPHGTIHNTMLGRLYTSM